MNALLEARGRMKGICMWWSMTGLLAYWHFCIWTRIRTVHIYLYVYMYTYPALPGSPRLLGIKGLLYLIHSLSQTPFLIRES